MSWRTEIDRLLRYSWLARAQPFIRSSAPWLHSFLLAARDRLLPFRSEHGVTRYQNRAIERFLSFGPAITGRLLEVGSDVEGRVLRELASRLPGLVIGVNPDVDFTAHSDPRDARRPYHVVRGDARALPFEDRSFSSILSIATFEHVHDLPTALDEMYRVLEPGALLYTDFGPIWSSSIGHHVFAIVDGVEARHWKPGRNPVPHFAHFLMDPEELRAAVLARAWVFPRLADAIVDWIYFGDGINRLFYEDYVRCFAESRFELLHLSPVREHVSRRRQRALERACPGYTEFGVRMVEAVLRKPAEEERPSAISHPP